MLSEIISLLEYFFECLEWNFALLVKRPVVKLKKGLHNPIEQGNGNVLSIGNQSIEDYLLMADIMQPFYVKELLSKQDWSIFAKEHPSKGRRPYSPQAIVGLILYGLMQGISSLRDLARMARIDLGCIFITEGVFPDRSSIGRFIQRHAELLSEEFFIQLTQRVLKATKSSVCSVAGDGTIIEAASSRYRLMRQEAIEECRNKLKVQVEANPEDIKLAEDIEKIEHVANELQKRINKRKEQHKPTESMTLNPLEPEAMVQPTKKGKTSVPSYKPSVLANDQRVIVAIDVHPSNEIESLFPMIDMANKIGKDEIVNELLLDGGYESHKVLEESMKRDISVLCTPGGTNKKKD